MFSQWVMGMWWFISLFFLLCFEIFDNKKKSITTIKGKFQPRQTIKEKNKWQ